MSSSRAKGYVQYVNRKERYGWIVPYGGSDPLYFDYSAFVPALTVVSEEQQVSFRIVFVAGRFEARDIEP